MTIVNLRLCYSIIFIAVLKKLSWDVMGCVRILDLKSQPIATMMQLLCVHVVCKLKTKLWSVCYIFIAYVLYVGRSSAAHCALSLFDRQESGHIWKQKALLTHFGSKGAARPHYIIPITLDDLKTAEGIGELLIDICNGCSVGNMKGWASAKIQSCSH